MTLVCVHCVNRLVLTHNRGCKSVQEKNIWPSFCFLVQGRIRVDPTDISPPPALPLRTMWELLYEWTTPSPHSLSLITCRTNKEPSISFTACFSEGACESEAISPGRQLHLQNAECEVLKFDKIQCYFFLFLFFFSLTE